MAVFFALAAFHLLDRHLETSGWPLAAGCPRSHAPRGNAVVPTLRVARADAERREANGSHAERGNQNSVTLAAAFSLCSILGFLSQLTFVSFYFATLVWSLYRLRRESKRRPSPPAGDHCRLGTPPDCNRGAFLAKRGFLNGIAVRTMLCCHAAPLLFLAAFYLIDIRHITGISGTPSSLLRSSIAVPAWALGSPSQAAAQIAGCAAAIAILVAGIWLLRGQRPDLCIFFPVAIVVFPVLLVAIRGSDVIYVRYFIIAIALLLLLFSFVLARLYRARAARQGGLCDAARPVCGAQRPARGEAIRVRPRAIFRGDSLHHRPFPAAADDDRRQSGLPRGDGAGLLRPGRRDRHVFPTERLAAARAGVAHLQYRVI